MVTAVTRETIRHRRALFRLGLGVSVLWFVVVAGYATSVLLENRAGCEVWMKLWGAEQRSWLRIDAPTAPVTRCAVSKHPISGFMVQPPIMPNIWFLGLAVLPFVGFYTGRTMLRFIRRRWRSKRRNADGDDPDLSAMLSYQDSIR